MKSVVLFTTIVTALYAAQPQLPPAFPRNGITKFFENERVVIWHGILGFKGEPTAMHHHALDLIGVFLDAGHVRTELADGTKSVGKPFERGAAVFQRRGMTHVEEVLVDGTRAVGVELKCAGTESSKPSPASGVDDGRVILDNECVEIREYVWSTGATLRRDSRRRDSIIVPLESGEVRMSGGSSGASVRFLFGRPVYRPRDAAEQMQATAGTPKAIVIMLK